MRARWIILLGCIALTMSGAASAFTLFGFRSAADIQNGQFWKWAPDYPALPQARIPFTLTYAIDSEFLTNQANVTPAQAREAVVNALSTWTGGTGGHIRMQEVAYSPVLNGSTNFACCPPDQFGVGPPSTWEGAGFFEWLDDRTLPGPGWGANIDVFSRPNGFRMWSQLQSTVFEMHAGILGFAIVSRQAGFIVSCDLYINESQVFKVGAAGPGFDLETVIVHELGHIFGFDHPNQAVAMGGVNLNPYTFKSGAPWCSCDVMHGGYTGVKRALTADEFGGLAFLYPAGAGDLTGDNRVTMVDVARAIAFLDGSVEPNPYELFTLDFVNRDGAVDVAEVTHMLEWATGMAPYDRFGPPKSRGAEPKQQAPSTITIAAVATPADVGKGGEAQVALHIENPNGVAVQSWSLTLSYDAAIFSNPRCANGNFPANSLKIANLTDDGLIEISNIAVAGDTSSTGLLATLTFDIDLVAAVAAQEAEFVLPDAMLVVSVGGQPRTYGAAPGETLLVSDASVVASDLDADRNGVIDLDDLYAWHTAPIDVNHDGEMDDADRETLARCIRGGEAAQMHPPGRIQAD